MKALVTGGEGGIGRAMRARLEREGYEVESLDLDERLRRHRSGRVGARRRRRRRLPERGRPDRRGRPQAVTDEHYRRAVAVNVDGVVLGVLRLRQVMERGAIVATASLAGLTGMPSDAVYSLTKHAVVGFVRSVAPLLEPIRVNAVCPGIADTPMIDAASARRFAEAGFPLLQPEDVAEAMWRAASSEATGECWFVQPGREPAPFRFPNLPGPAARRRPRRRCRRSMS